MQKALFIIFLLFSTHLDLRAQQFEWASAGGNIAAGFKASVVDQQENIIVVGHAMRPPTYFLGASYLYSSNGDSLEVDVLNDPLLIVSFNKSGKINWKKEIRNGDDEEAFIAVNSKNNIVVLARSNHNGTILPAGPRVPPYTWFLYTLNDEGEGLAAFVDTAELIKDPTSFFITADDNLIIAGSRDIKTKNSSDRICTNYLLKCNNQLQVIWQQQMEYKKCNGHFVPGCLADIAPNGDIYVCLTAPFGVTFGKGTSFTAPIIDKTKGDTPFEAYLACYTNEGTLKWAGNSGGKSNFYSIKATNTGVLLGGTIINNINFFGNKIDTTNNKQMVLASFNNKGKLLWSKTSAAFKITSITTDKDENIYAIVDSKVGYPYLLFETDTLRSATQTLVIASYKSNGNYRWAKNCKIPISLNTLPQLKTDRCGNIYVSGEMWSVLRSQLKWFDGAFVKGNGYGPTPFVARLKNTLPEKIAEQVVKQKNVCVISPSPWTLYNYPNPFTTQTTIQYKTSYTDNNVSLLLYDITGRFIKPIFRSKSITAGTYTVILSADNLSKGVYVLVLKGTEAVATERIVLQ